MTEYFEKLLASINDSINHLDYDMFDKMLQDVLETERSGHKTIVTGLGKNVPICEKFVGSMLSLGLNAAFMHSNSAVHGDLGVVRDGDLVLLLTKSGNTAESIYLYEHLKKRNAKVWLLTFNADSVLAKEVENVFCMTLDHEGDLWDIMPNNSTTLYLIVLQALAICSAKALNIQLQDFKPNHPGGAIGEKLKDE